MLRMVKFKCIATTGKKSLHVVLQEVIQGQASWDIGRSDLSRVSKWKVQL